MSENAGQKAEDKELRELRAEYWSKRLDHTLTHTQTSSRLIYLIDGAVLALVYFSVQTLCPTRSVILIGSLPTFLLAVLNGLHARLITLQHSWYSGIDTRLPELLAVDPVQHTKTLKGIVLTTAYTVVNTTKAQLYEINKTHPEN